MLAKTLSRRRGMIWGLSLHGWEEIMRGAIAAVGIFGLLVGVATYFVVTLTREEAAESKRQFEEYKIEAAGGVTKSNERIAELSTQAERLRNETARLQTDNLALQTAMLPRYVGAIGIDGRPPAETWFAGFERWAGIKI